MCSKDNILRKIPIWAAKAKQKPDKLQRGSPHMDSPATGPGITRKKRKAPAILMSFLSVMLCFTTVAQANSMTDKTSVNSNGTYTVIATDEAGNKTMKNVTIGNIKDLYKDEDGNVQPLPGLGDTDEDYSEEIIATLMDDRLVTTNGKYTVMVTDEAGNITTLSVNVKNINEQGPDPGKDAEGNTVPDDVKDTEEDYTEEIKDNLVSTQTVTSNGQFTAFIYDEAGNLAKRSYTVTNIIEGSQTLPGQLPSIKPDDVDDTDEDYTESIRSEYSNGTNVKTNGMYSAMVYDEAGNISVVNIKVDNIYQANDPENPEPPEEGTIIPDDVPSTDEDYSEDIVEEKSNSLTVTKSGIYAAIVIDETQNIGLTSAEVTIKDPDEPDEPEDPENPKPPVIDYIKPDTPGSEYISDEGGSKTDTITVYENGLYAAGGTDSVGNTGLESILVTNIGAPDVTIIDNPKTLVRKTAPDGSTYGEATVTFTVVVPDGTLLDYVRVLDEEGNEQPLSLSNSLYTTTITKNGKYYINACDVTNRDIMYPLLVDYIYELNTPEVVEALEGTIAELPANIEGGTAEKYQWYKCDADGSNPVPLIGETGEVYAVTATNALDETYYFVTATNGDYTVVSKPIKLVVYYAPVLASKGYIISTESYPVNMTIGHSAADSIQITKDGHPDDYSYQWYYAVSARAAKQPIPGATSAKYTITPDASMNGYYYFCEVSTSKCKVMSDPLYLYVCGKPTPPIITGRIPDGTIIKSDTWAITQPLTVTINGSVAAGTVGTMEYQYSYDQIHWFNYERPLQFTEETENTTIYAKAVNAGLATVESDISSHIVRIELTDPSLHPDDDDVVPGVRFNQEEWVSEPKNISIYVNTLSGITNIDVYFKAEGESDFRRLVDERGINSRYKLDDTLVDGEHFTCTRIQEGLWRINFGAAENGDYYVTFFDTAGRPIEAGPMGTSEFRVYHVEYGKPIGGTVTIDKEDGAHANDATITVTDSYDKYEPDVFGSIGYSQLYAYAYTVMPLGTDEGETPIVVTPPAKDSDEWKVLTESTSTITQDAKGTDHHTFNIPIAGHDANGIYYIWVRDLAGNVTEVFKSDGTRLVVDGLMDKMQNVQCDTTPLSLTVPEDGIIKATFKGEPMDIIPTTTDEKVATVDWRMAGPDCVEVVVTPQDVGTCSIGLTLRDYDGTTYHWDVTTTVRNMVPTMKTELADVQVKPGEDAVFTAVYSGTNLKYQWFYSKTPGSNGTPISADDAKYVMAVEDTNRAQHTVKLTVKSATEDMTGTYFWCVATATEGTPEYTKQTRTALLTVVGKVSQPTIVANSGALTSGTWTNGDISFLFTGSTIASGSGSIAYEYRYDDNTEWTPCDGTLVYSGDTHETVLHVQAYNTLDHEVVSENDADFIIRVDSVAPVIGGITGNPTTWVSTDQTLTITATDADSGMTAESANIIVRDSAGVETKAYNAVSDGVYTFVVKKSDTFTVIIHDLAGNEASTELVVDKIDRGAPTISIQQGTPDGSLCPVTIYATDDASQASQILYTFDGGATWQQSNMEILTVGQTYTLGAKDAAGNKTTRNLKITGNSGGSGGGGGGGSSKPIIISTSDLAVEDYQLGKENYVDSSGTMKPYETHTVNGENIKCLPIEITAAPSAGGYLAGYAKLSTGQKFPIYWTDEEAGTTSTVSSSGGTGVFYFDPSVVNTSVRDGKITVFVGEYQDAELTKKVAEDSMSSPIMLDMSGPTVSIFYNQVTDQVTITARDALSGITSVKYAIEDADGNVSSYVDYTGPFSKPANCRFVIVEATDNVGNTSTKTSAALDGSGAGGGGAAGGGGGLGGPDGIAGTAFAGAYYYRTSMFNYYLYNG